MMKVIFNIVVLNTIAALTFQPAFADESVAWSNLDAHQSAIKDFQEKLSQLPGNLNVRERPLDSGRTLFQISWETGGETSLITCELRPLGKYEDSTVFCLFADSPVAELLDGSMPPAIIKAVATRNEQTVLGFYSMPEGFGAVHVNVATPSDTLTTGQLWMIFAWLHKHRLEFKNEIELLLKAAG